MLKVGRPAFGQAQQTIGMFVLTPDGSEAERRTVKLGRNSVSTIEISKACAKATGDHFRYVGIG